MSSLVDARMADAGLLGVERFVARRSVANQLQDYLRRAGENGCEGVGFWLGVRGGSTFRVSEGVAPQQEAVRSRDGGVAVLIHGDELHKLNVWLYRRGLEIGVQVHSHPGEAYHSETDDDFAVATRAGSLSVVVPDFAQRAFALEECAVYRLDRAGKWQHVPPAAVGKLIQLVDE